MYQIDKAKDQLIYQRNATHSNGEQFDLSGLNALCKTEQDQQFLNFIAMGTSDNRLFLLECFERNIFKQLDYISCLQDVFYWFKRKLNIIFPKSKYHGLELELQQGGEVADQLATVLDQFDTGVGAIKLQQLDFEHEVDLPPQLKSDLLKDLAEEEAVLVSSGSSRFQIKRDGSGEISAYKLMAAHSDSV